MLEDVQTTYLWNLHAQKDAYFTVSDIFYVASAVLGNNLA